MKHNAIITTCVVVVQLAVLAKALPPDVEKLIQEDKHAEALARVEVLLKEKPQDPELRDLRAALAAETKTSGTTAAAAPQAMMPATPAKPAQPSALEKRELDLVLADLGRATGTARQAILKELESRTRTLSRVYPDAAEIWAMRAMAALELDQTEAGREAAANLLRLGADRSNNDQMLTLLAMLGRKGWRLTSEQLAEEKKQEETLATKKQSERVAQTKQNAEAERKAAARRASPEGNLEENFRKGLISRDTYEHWKSLNKKK